MDKKRIIIVACLVCAIVVALFCLHYVYNQNTIQDNYYVNEKYSSGDISNIQTEKDALKETSSTNIHTGVSADERNNIIELLRHFADFNELEMEIMTQEEKLQILAKYLNTYGRYHDDDSGKYDHVGGENMLYRGCSVEEFVELYMSFFGQELDINLLSVKKEDVIHLEDSIVLVMMSDGVTIPEITISKIEETDNRVLVRGYICDYWSTTERYILGMYEAELQRNDLSRFGFSIKKYKSIEKTENLDFSKIISVAETIDGSVNGLLEEEPMVAWMINKGEGTIIELQTADGSPSVVSAIEIYPGFYREQFYELSVKPMYVEITFDDGETRILECVRATENGFVLPPFGYPPTLILDIPVETSKITMKMGPLTETGGYLELTKVNIY